MTAIVLLAITVVAGVSGLGGRLVAGDDDPTPELTLAPPGERTGDGHSPATDGSGPASPTRPPAGRSGTATAPSRSGPGSTGTANAAPGGTAAPRSPRGTPDATLAERLPLGPGGVPVGALRPERYGAVGDGRADDTAALQRALDALRPGGALALTAGRTYAHSAVLRLGVAGTTITGTGRLLATRPEQSALWLDADDVTVSGITLACVPPPQRYTAYEQMKLRSSHHRGITITGVNIERSAAAGIFLEDVSSFAITDVRIADTEADGIHLTGGTQDGTVTRPVVVRPGDDGVAVVSYGSDPRPSARIVITSPSVSAQSWGRGVSVVGGEDITYRDVRVNGSAGAAIYIASEGAPYFTRSVARVTVSGGQIDNANTDASIGHGAVLVYAGRSDTSVSGVTITGLHLARPLRADIAGISLRCAPGRVSGIGISAVSLSRAFLTPFSSTCEQPRPLDLRTVP